MDESVSNQKIVGGYRLILGYLGIFIMMIGVILLLPLLILPFYWHEARYAYCFIIPGIFALFCGAGMSFLLKGKQKMRLRRHQDTILLLAIWIIAILFGSFPFLLDGKDFIHSIFEATSGFSTTGFTVFEVESFPHIFLMFRTIMLFVGGVGLVLVLTSALSDRFGIKLYAAEGHSDRLMPNLAKSARLILTIYFGYIAVGTIAFLICGMPLFDAFNHAIASVATGGFSTKNNIAYILTNAGIEVITMILMLLGSTNFIIHLYILKGKYRKAFRHCEFKFILVLLLIFIPLMINSLLRYSATGYNFGESLRFSLFHIISAFTTTGFHTVDSLTLLPSSILFYLIILMVIGGGVGSTSGGIKQARFILWFKSMFWHVRDRLSHKRTIRTNYLMRLGQKEVITPLEINNNNAFVSIYFTVLIIGTIGLTACGVAFESALFEFASALGGVGFSVGVISPTASFGVLLITTIGMFMGRLDLIVVFVALGKIGSDISRRRII